MAYNSYYKRDNVPGLEKEKGSEKAEISTVSIAGPLTFWVGLLVVAAVLQIIAIPFATAYGHTAFNSYLNDFANYVIYLPGLVVLPLIASLWVGDRVSFLDRKKSFIAYKGIVNAIYTALVYVVAIFIIYLIMRSQQVGVLATFSPLVFAEYLLLIPFAINIVIIPIFALLSSARRYS